MTSPIHLEQPAVRTASDATAAHIGRETAFGARNYDPLPVVLGQGAGAWLTDVDGKRYLDLMSAYSAVSFGHAHPQNRGGARRAGATARGHVARVPQRPAARAARTPGEDDRPGSRVAVQRRRGGGRDGTQGGAQVGIPREGHSGRPGRDHRLRKQLPRPLDRDRRLFVGAAIPGWLRAVSSRIRHDPVRRRHGAGRGHHAEHRGLPGRADPGRGRHHRAAGGVSRAMRAHLPRTQCPADLRRDTDRAWPHGLPARVPARSACAPMA